MGIIIINPTMMMMMIAGIRYPKIYVGSRISSNINTSSSTSNNNPKRTSYVCTLKRKNKVNYMTA